MGTPSVSTEARRIEPTNFPVQDHPTENSAPRSGTQATPVIIDVDEARACSENEPDEAKSLTGSLPSEVLAYIFHHAIQLGPPRTRPQFIIGAVCSHWRTVLWNTPCLWEEFEQECWDSRRDTHALLQTYFDHSGTLPISVHVGFQCYFDEGCAQRQTMIWYKEADILKPTRTTMFLTSNAERIHRLRLDRLPPSWLLLARQHCTRLRTIEIVWRGVFGFGAVGQELKNIWDRMKAQLPWTTLTSLSIGEVPLDVCCGLLAGCPNLVDFSSECCLPLQHVQPSEKDIVMKHLQCLRLRPCDISQYSQFRSFQFPVLRHFGGSAQGPPKPTFDQFLPTIPLTVTTLELRISVATEDKMKMLDWLSGLFSRMPQLTQLSLTILTLTPLCGLFLVLHELALLPSLRVLQCGYRSPLKNERATMSFLQLVEQKKKVGIQSFRFDSLNACISWPEDIQDRLRSLNEQGFNLEISEDGVMVPWLSDI